MGLLESATTFGQLVGLVGMFQNEGRYRRDKAEQKQYQGFKLWLEEHNHNEVLELLEGNKQLAESLQHLIESNHETVMAELGALNASVAGIALRLESLSSVASAVGAKGTLSDQAVSILEQLNAMKASKFMETASRAGVTFVAMDGEEGVLSLTDERFVVDDLRTLCNHILLISEVNEYGNEVFHITRAGAIVGS